MSSIECIVLDFDGTFTRVDEEAVPFVEAFRRELAAELGKQIDDRWNEAAARIDAEPARFGWEYEGAIVAPSHADPYIRCTSIGQLILDDEGYAPPRRADLLQALYRRCYPLSFTLFRHDAKMVVEALIASGLPMFVVTNSATAHVQAKIDSLVANSRDAIRVIGDARKYVLHEPEKSNPLFEALPSEMEVPGLGRPIFLRRGYYFEALKRIWDETRTRPESTFVCGDIFELDLAMPARLGTRVHLITRPNTPEYERRSVRGIPEGSASNDLAGLLSELDLPG